MRPVHDPARAHLVQEISSAGVHTEMHGDGEGKAIDSLRIQEIGGRLYVFLSMPQKESVEPETRVELVTYALQVRRSTD